MPNSQNGTPVLYLDIDGTVRQGKDDALGRFVNGPEDVVVFPEAVEMMRRWKAAAGRIIGVSNQGGIALGIVDPAKVAAAMMETHRQAEHLFDKIAWCQHHPDAKHPEMARCWCRKPMAGLLIESALHLAHAHDEMYPPYMGLMVGDRSEDEACAAAAGLDFQWAADWRSQANGDTRPNPSTTCNATGPMNSEPCTKAPGHVDQGDEQHENSKMEWRALRGLDDMAAVFAANIEAADADSGGDTCITCQQVIEPDEPAEQDSPAGGRWHTRCAEQCPHCTSDRRQQRFVMPTTDGSAPCGHGWHDMPAAGNTPSSSPESGVQC